MERKLLPKSDDDMLNFCCYLNSNREINSSITIDTSNLLDYNTFSTAIHSC